MSKSRENKFRKHRATKKLLAWRKQRGPAEAVVVPVEIVAVQGSLPKR